MTSALSAVVLIASGLGWESAQGVQRASVVDGAPSAPTAEQNILLVGIDSRTDAHGEPLPAATLAALHAGSSSDGGVNTDTMIVIHVPAGGRAATAFSIPRDSYLHLAGDFGEHKINTAYTYGAVAARASLAAAGLSGPALTVAADEAGAREAVATVQDLTGLSITHYAAVDLAAFSAISTAVGGVQVCLTAATQDDYSGADFPAGVQTVQGASALAFVRQRHGLPGGDLDRIRRQQVFMATLSGKVLSAGTLGDPGALAGILAAVQDNVVLDRSWDLLSFARQMQGLTAGAVTFRTVPTGSTDLSTPTDGTAVAVDPARVRSSIAQTIDPAIAPRSDPRVGTATPAGAGASTGEGAPPTPPISAGAVPCIA